MSFFNVLANNAVTITGNGFIKVQGPIQVTYSLSNSSTTDATDFEGFTTSLSTTTYPFNNNSFTIGSTSYTSVTLSGNKILFSDNNYIELFDNDIVSNTTKYTKYTSTDDYILYDTTYYKLLVHFNFSDNTIQIKQLYDSMQIGSNIYGDLNDDLSGHSVSLSSNGTIVAIGAYKHDNLKGTVKVYQMNGTSWSQLGSDIDGNIDDLSGWSVSLSSNGNIVAIGAYKHDNNKGTVRVYQWNGTIWSQLGSDIDGDVANDFSGHSVSLSSDGTIVAIGAYKHDNLKGTVRVYQRDINNTTNSPIGWTQLGSDIDGDEANDLSGWSVSLSSNGSIVAIGAHYNDGNGTNSGHVRVYQWNRTSWLQLGSDIDGEIADEESGYSVSLSSDGTIVAIGAYKHDNNKGTVRVYQRDITNTTNSPIGWKKLGSDIDGEEKYDYLGTSVSLSSDGTIVAIGAIRSGQSIKGTVRVYQWNGTNWKKIYTDIDGETANDYFGNSVSLSSDGTIVAIGAPYYNYRKGITKIYHLPSNSIAEISESKNISSSTYITLEKKPYSITEKDILHIEDYESLISSTTNTGSGNTSIAINYTGGFLIDDISYTSISLTGSHIQFDGSDVYFDIGNGVTSGTNWKYNDLTNSNGKLQILYDIPNSHYMIAELDCLRNKTNLYRYNKAIQLGSDINGEEDGDISGNSVSLSSDGTIVAIGAPYNDGNGTNNGHVRVFQWRQYTNDDKNNSTYHYTSYEQGTTNTKPLIITANTSTAPDVGTYYWTQVGSDINGLSTNQGFFGWSVSLSSDGYTVAIGGHGWDSYGKTNDGIVRIYYYNGTNWVSKGQSLYNYLSSYTSFGYSISLSSDGNIVAIGAYRYSSTDNGIVGVFKYSRTNTSWSRLGEWIFGEASYDYSGISVSLSSDGTIVAIGAHGNDGNGTNSGHVRVFQWNGTSWTQLGSDIDGEASGDESGINVSLSSDGTIVAIGAYKNDGNGTDSGHVRVYEYTNSSWRKLGSDIDGGASEDESGISVSLIKDNINGIIVAIGAHKNNGNGTDSGHVRVYKYNTSIYNWVKIYEDIDGEASEDNSGNSVSLSSDGTTVAIGARYNDGNGNNSGHVRVYKLSPDLWPQLGSDIKGESSGDYFGSSVSLSSDGTIVAIGAPYNDGNGTDSGHVRVFEWRQYTQDDKNNNTYHYTSYTQDSSQTNPLIITANTSTAPVVGTYYWTQVGSDIDGESKEDQFGVSVSLSSDGTIVAIGANLNDENGENSGHVRVFQWRQYTSSDSNTYHYTSYTQNSSQPKPLIITANTSTAPVVGTYYWTQLGFDINGEVSNDYFGWSVSLSSNGNIVAIGAPYNDRNVTDSGHVRVFQWRQYTSSDSNTYHYTSYTQNSSQPKPLIITANTSTAPVVGTYYWTQIGYDINGEAGYDYSGTSVSLSSDGTIVVIGANLNGGNGVRSGHVRVFQWRQYTSSDSNTYHYTSYTQNSTQPKPLIITANTSTAPQDGTYYWTQVGFDINGEAEYDYSGESISLSSDGTIVAIGVKLNDGSGNNGGHVRVFQWRQYTDSDSGNYHYTSYTQNSTQPKPLIITANTSTAPVVGTYYWTQLGSDIDGNNYFGYSVSLSSNGYTIAIGSFQNKKSYLYKYENSSWVYKSSFDGYKVSLSSDGETIGCGDPTDTSNTGKVKIYSYDTETETIGFKYRTSKDIVETTAPVARVGGFNYLFDN